MSIKYTGFANGRWLSDTAFQHNDGRITEREYAHPEIVYCGSCGTKRLGKPWRDGELQPRLGLYLHVAEGEAADDSKAAWRKKQ